jgi:hypothetical protein
LSNPYTIALTVTNKSGSTTPANLAVNFELDTATLVTAGKMRSDCGDIRIYSDAGRTTLVKHFVESGRNTGHTSVWLKLSATIAASGQATYYLTYGDTTLTSVEDPANTVTAYEGFESGLTGWTNVGTSGVSTQSSAQKVDGTYSVRVYDNSTGYYGGRRSADGRFLANDKQTVVFWVRPVTDPSGSSIVVRVNRPVGITQFYMARDDANGYRGYDGSAFFTIASNAQAPTGSWYRIRFKLDLTSTPKKQKEIKIWDEALSQIGSTISDKNTYNYDYGSDFTDFHFQSSMAGIAECFHDQIFSYPYIDTDPSVALGTETGIVAEATAQAFAATPHDEAGSVPTAEATAQAPAVLGATTSPAASIAEASIEAIAPVWSGSVVNAAVAEVSGEAVAPTGIAAGIAAVVAEATAEAMVVSLPGGGPSLRRTYPAMVRTYPPLCRAV